MEAVPLHIVVLSEARDVLCELRRNRRFGYLHSFVSITPLEHPLVKDVKRVREVLRTSMRRNGYEVLQADALSDALDPFLRVIRSRDTSGNITGAALSSLDRIVVAILSMPSKLAVSYAPVLESVVFAAASCKFDASDPSKDEVVLSRIARVIARILCHEDITGLLSDAALLEGFQACLDIAGGRRRASELSRRSADTALIDIAHALGTKLLPALTKDSANAIQGSTSQTSSPRLLPHKGSLSLSEPHHISHGQALQEVCDFDSAAPSLSSSCIADYITGGFFGNAFDFDAHSKRGPATLDVVTAIFELACRLSDPSHGRPESERLLGLQLLSSILSGAGSVLRLHLPLRRLLLRECSRAVLRAVASFKESTQFISAAFNASTHLVHALGSEATAFLSALLQGVFPYYISGYEGVMPRIATFEDLSGIVPEGISNRMKTTNLTETDACLHARFPGQFSDSGSPSDKARNVSNGLDHGDSLFSHQEHVFGVTDPSSASDGVFQHARIDPVVREIGLEALCGFVAIPGLLASLYEVKDCSFTSMDVVSMLLSALGGSVNSRLLRKKRKRLRGVGDGSLASTTVIGDDETDDEDEEEQSLISAVTSGDARDQRMASALCCEALLAIVDSIADELKDKCDTLHVLCNGAVANEMSASSLHRDVHSFRAMKVRKRQLQRTAYAFNSPSFSPGSAKMVLDLLRKFDEAEDVSVAKNSEEESASAVRSVVRLFRETPGLHKGKVGVVLGEPDKMSQAVLTAYTDTFDFADRPFTECLRIYLESFRLPGESQKIDRIVESFANRFYVQNKGLEDQSEISGRGVSETSAGRESLPLLFDASVSDSDKNVRVTDAGSNASESLAPHGSPSLSATRLTSGFDGLLPQSASNRSVGCETHIRRPHSARGVFATADAVHVLSFAAVMLNTDQHNASIRKKMTLEDFIRNNRGINANEDLPKWFLTQVFESIAACEIRLSDEAGMSSLTDLHWDEQLRNMFSARQFLPSLYSAGLLDEDVFSVCWGYCVSAATVMFNEASDSSAVQMAVDGFLGVAKCGAAYRRSEPVDVVVSVLTMATSIREGPLYGAAVKFGTDVKAQMAAVALSGISREFGDWLGTYGYRSLIAYILRLHALGLLPDALEDALGGYGDDLTGVNGIPLPESDLIPNWWPSACLRKNRGQDLGSSDAVVPKRPAKVNSLFALIAASIGSDVRDTNQSMDDDVYDAVPPAYMKVRNAEEAEAKELARKCIEGCHIEDILINEAKVLRSEALASLSEALSYSAFEVFRGVPDESDANWRHDLPGSNVNQAANGQYAASAQGPNQPADSDASDSAQMKVTNTSASSEEPCNTHVRTPFAGLSKADSSIITGVARLVRNSQGSIESDVVDEYFATSSSWSGPLRKRDERKGRDCVVAFCIDVLCELTLQNRDRLHIPWPALHSILLRVIDKRTRSLCLVERAVVALLRIANRLLHRDELHSDVVRGLNLLVNLPAKTVEQLSAPVAGGVYNIVKTYGARISSISGWHAILSILENCARYSAPSCDIGFSALSVLLQDDPSFESVSAETFSPLLDAVMAYSASSSVDMSARAVDLLMALSERIPKLVFPDGTIKAGFGKDQAGTDTVENDAVSAVSAVDHSWSEYWDPLLRGFCVVARDSRGKVRNHALAVLEKVIATSKLSAYLNACQWETVFRSILVPLTNELFNSNGLLRATEEAEKSAQRELMASRSAVMSSSSVRGKSARTNAVSAEHEHLLSKTVKAACDRTRLRAVSVLSKTFLQHHACMANGLPSDRFTKIWLEVLQSVASVLRPHADEALAGVVSYTDDEIHEHVPECIKNIMLVLFTNGLLDKEKDSNRWEATFSIIQEHLPDLEMEEVLTAAVDMPDTSSNSISNQGLDHSDSGEAGNTMETTLEVDEHTARSSETCAEGHITADLDHDPHSGRTEISGKSVSIAGQQTDNATLPQNCAISLKDTT